MKTFARASATALLLSLTSLGLALPTAGPALAGNCATCIYNAPATTAELGPAWGGQSTPAGGCGNCWGDSATAAPGPARITWASDCHGCWPNEVTPAGRNRAFANA